MTTELTMDLRLGDAHELIRTLPDASVDAIITDPPYGVFRQVDAHLDTPPRPELWHECYRVARRDAWLAVFCQMPILAQWHHEITQAGWRYVEHIAWLKRTQTPAPSGLLRSHESILLYRKGKAKLYDKTAPYWDTKVPLLAVGSVDIDGIKRCFEDIMRFTKGNGRHTRRGLDTLHAVHARFKANFRNIYNIENTNIGNVWSFLNPRGHRKRHHPTEKPLPLLERLVRLLTCEGQVVLDPFLGSGTTAVACAKLGRACIGYEHNAQYMAVAHQRVHEVHGQLMESL